MKWLKYTVDGAAVRMGWNEANEEVAKREADNGEYTIYDDGQPVKVSADDVLNALLGVSRYA